MGSSSPSSRAGTSADSRTDGFTRRRLLAGAVTSGRRPDHWRRHRVCGRTGAVSVACDPARWPTRAARRTPAPRVQHRRRVQRRLGARGSCRPLDRRLSCKWPRPMAAVPVLQTVVIQRTDGLLFKIYRMSELSVENKTLDIDLEKDYEICKWWCDKLSAVGEGWGEGFAPTFPRQGSSIRPRHR